MASGRAPVAARGNRSKVRGRADGGAQRRPGLGTVFRLKWQGGQRTAGRDIERPTMAVTSNTQASFNLNTGPQSDVMPLA